MAIKYSPYDDSLWSNPWPLYRQMQDEAPAYYIEELDCWALTRFDDIWQASMDRHSYTATAGTSTDALFIATEPPPPVFLFMDGQMHGQHRGLIARPYNKDKIALIDDLVRDIVRELMQPMLAAGTLDVYKLASRTALYTNATFMGLEREEISHIRSLIDIFFLREPGVRGTTEKGSQAFAEAHAYIVDLIKRYRKNPPADHTHIGTWLKAEMAEGPLTEEQIFYNIFAMVITGSDTVPLTTAGCVRFLDLHRDQLAQVRADPGLIPGAFEEAARIDQPTNLLGRRIVRDVELHGQTMKAGQSILFLYAAAGRDEREFEQPDVFDINRRPRRTLSFGTGIHFCLGQHLARLEGRIILEEIMAAIPEFEVDYAASKRIRGEFLQGYCTLPIHFRPR